MSHRSAFVVVFLMSGCGAAPTPAVVDPRVGSGGFGFAVGSAFVGAAAPHGLAKAAPDTSGPMFGAIGFLHCSGYWYGDDTVQGYSNLHLHGTGVPDLGVLAFMPLTSFEPAKRTKAAYAQKLIKDSEQAEPAYYALTLENQTRTEITATAHAAHYRIAYPSGEAHLLVDLDHALDSGKVMMASVTLAANGTSASGQLLAQGDMSGHYGGATIYFELRAKQPWTAAKLWQAGVLPMDGTTATGSGVGFDLAFDGGTPVEVQLGLSLVSAEGARANLDAEMPRFDFDGERAGTAADWQALVDKVQISGGTVARQRTFFAAMYHLWLMPTDIADVDGRYFGQDGVIHDAEGGHFYSDLSLWDTYRTLHPLYAIIAPDRALTAARSLVAMADQSGAFPKWPLLTGETGVMLGASSEVVLADAYAKGLTGFDAERSYQIMHAAATSQQAPPGGRGGREDVVPYMDYGYVPSDHGGSVSRTTEYAYDDFALANLAEALGHGDDAAALRERSHSYRKLFDPATGFLRGLSRSGERSSNFDPTAFVDEFVEANAWQSTWYAQHDIDGLITLFGGAQAMIAKLSEFFDQAKLDWDGLAPDDTLKRAAQRPYYWGGNEPDIQAPYMFAQAGRPDLTQKWVRWSMDALFGDGPDGLPGNDDGGAMSAWYVFSAMGLYPIAGSDRYIVGAPYFPHLTFEVAGGTFSVDAPEVSDTNLYVQSVTLDGKPLDKPELRHSDLHAGGTLTFTMGPRASSWGR